MKILIRKFGLIVISLSLLLPATSLMAQDSFFIEKSFRKKSVICQKNKRGKYLPGVLIKDRWQSVIKLNKKKLKKAKVKQKPNLSKITRKIKKQNKQFKKLCKAGQADQGEQCYPQVVNTKLNAKPGERLTLPLVVTEDCGLSFALEVADSPLFGTTELNNNSLSYTAPEQPGRYVVNVTAGTGKSASSSSHTFIVSGETHDVAVLQHSFSPKNLTVNEGDTVVWTWNANFHDVVAGTDPDVQSPYDKVFSTSIAFEGFTYDFKFDRDTLINSPASSNRYQYYCTPHYQMGMKGSVRVNKREHLFKAISGGSACKLKLSKDETTLRVECQKPPAANAFRLLTDTAAGPREICRLREEQNLYGADCILPAGAADSLFAGELSIEKTDTLGQIFSAKVVSAGGSNSISGTVSSAVAGINVAGIQVTDGYRVAYTDSSGSFSFDGVPNGSYDLRAIKNNCRFAKASGHDITVVNDQNKLFRDFSLLGCN